MDLCVVVDIYKCSGGRSEVPMRGVRQWSGSLTEKCVHEAVSCVGECVLSVWVWVFLCVSLCLCVSVFV